MDDKTLLTTDHLPALIAGFVLLIATALAFKASGRRGDRTASPLAARLGLTEVPAPLVWVFGTIWTALFASFVLGLFWLMLTLMVEGPARTAGQATDYRWYLLTLTALTAALGAVVALPFTLLRTAYTARQTRTAEENLTTDLINKAVEGLGAQKEVNRLGRTLAYTIEGSRQTVFETVDARRHPPEGADDPDYGDWLNITLSEPNLEVRIGAILSLERIARQRAEADRPDGDADHVRIMEILCAYIRENAPASDAQDHGLGDWTDYPEDTRAHDLAQRMRELTERTETLRAWANWLRAEHRPRSDIHTALEVIGRRSPRQIAIEAAAPGRGDGVGYRLDLRATNLQAADLARLDGARLAGAILRRARLEGADLRRAQLEGAVLRKARLDLADLDDAWLKGADLSGATLEDATLRRAGLESVNLKDARLQKANLRTARIEGADLTYARAERAEIIGAQMETTVLFGARMEGADCTEAKLSFAKLTNSRLDQANLKRATLSGATLYGARLGGAVLEDAGMQVSDLFLAEMQGADLTGARCVGARWALARDNAAIVPFADLRIGNEIGQERLSSLVGNAATLLPETPEGEPRFYVADKWAVEPQDFAALVANLVRSGMREEEVRKRYLCGPDEVPRKTGTPWPVDADPPWGAQGADEDDFAYRRRVTEWADAQPPGDPIA